MVDSGLAAWLAQLPIVAAVGDALVVHGGVPQKGLAAAIQSANRYVALARQQRSRMHQHVTNDSPSFACL